MLVNNIPVIIADDGSYSVLLELAKGQNIIEIKTIQAKNTISEQIAVTFEPPPAIIMTLNYDQKNVYNQLPIIVDGTVNNPAAEVTIYQSSTLHKEMAAISVASDGTYSAQLRLIEAQVYQPLVITAAAKLGNQIDTFSRNIGTGSDGPFRGTMLPMVCTGTLLE